MYYNSEQTNIKTNFCYFGGVRREKKKKQKTILRGKNKKKNPLIAPSLSLPPLAYLDFFFFFFSIGDERVQVHHNTRQNLQLYIDFDFDSVSVYILVVELILFYTLGTDVWPEPTPYFTTNQKSMKLQMIPL